MQRLAQIAQTGAEVPALQHAQMTVRVAAKMDVLDAGTVVHTIALDALGHAQDTVLDATIDAQHRVRHHALAVLDAVHAEVHADPNVHLHAWEDARSRVQIAALRFAEDAVLHALETAALRAENSAQMAAQVAVVAVQVDVRAVARIHAVQDAQHQQKLKRRNVKGLAHLVAELSARQAVRIQRKEIAEAHAELHAQPAVKLDAVGIVIGYATEHVRMNVRVVRQHAQMTVRVAAKRIASRPAR